MTKRETALVLAILLMLTAAFAQRTPSQTPRDERGSDAGFLHPGGCYNFTLPIASGAYKVLDISDRTWIKVEIQAGPAANRRQFWMNLGTVSTVTQLNCQA